MSTNNANNESYADARTRIGDDPDELYADGSKDDILANLPDVWECGYCGKEMENIHTQCECRSTEEPADPIGLDEFYDQYVETALWSSTETDEDGNDLGNLDDNYDADDLTDEAKASMRADCKAFLIDNAELIGDRYSDAGHDFWLTRNGHGAGFWDGDWSQEAGKALTAASKAYGTSDIMPDDSGKLHVN